MLSGTLLTSRRALAASVRRPARSKAGWKRRWLSSQKPKEEGEAANEAKEEAKEVESGGFFSSFRKSIREQIEQDAELKKSLDEMKQAVASVQSEVKGAAAELAGKTKKEEGGAEEANAAEAGAGQEDDDSSTAKSASASSSSAAAGDADADADAEATKTQEGDASASASSSSQGQKLSDIDGMRQNAQERMKSFASKAQEAAGESETAKQAREKAGQAAERLKEGLKDSETAKQAQEQFSSFRSKLGESTEKLFEANPLLKKGAERLKKQQDDLKGSEKVQGAFTVIQESIQEARDDLMGRKTMKQREEAAKAAVEAKRAEEEAAAAAAGPWKAFKDEETGDTYYYNSETEETQWEVPEGLKTRSGEDGGAGGDAAAGDGPSELVLVKDDSASTWERIRERMRRTPLISDILGAAGKAGAQFQQSSAGQNAAKARDRVEDFTEDFRERWETSQNPWVYSLASAWDGITAETEEAACVKEMRRLDPSWDEWQFLQDVENEMTETVVSAYLRGDMEVLSEWCAEQAYGMVNVAVSERKNEGMTLATDILEIGEAEILASRLLERAPPIFVVRTVVQQIHCVKDKDGNIIDGAEDDIRQVFYVFALQREWNEEEAALKWRLLEFQEVASFGYL